jgi:NADP-dependent 3-hydroxy acid dehydrogenase YdfG
MSLNWNWQQITFCGSVCLLNLATRLLGQQHKFDGPKSNFVIVITGCDTGFGNMAALDLMKQGFRVIATCYSETGASKLKESVSACVICDVTSESDVQRLGQFVEDYLISNNCQLWSVINNAGIAIGGYLDWQTMDEFRKVMEVNYFGVVAVTKALLPMLKRTQFSRIINISSLAGHVGGASMCSYSGENTQTVIIFPSKLVVLQLQNMLWRVSQRVFVWS